MAQYRAEISKKNKYWISKHRFYEICHHCFQYPEWQDEYKVLSKGSLRSTILDGMPRGLGNGDSTAAAAFRLVELKRKIDTVERVAKEADEQLWKYILKAVTTEGVTYNYLHMVMGMACGKDMYYDRRRKFYWLMNKELR